MITSFVTALSVAIALVAVLLCAVTDVRDRIIPNYVTYPAVALLLILAVWEHRLGEASAGAAILALPLLSVYLITARRALGLGDVKLAGVIGAAIGPAQAVIVLAIACSAVAAAGAIALFRRKTQRTAHVPFGAILAGATIVAIAVANVSLPGRAEGGCQGFAGTWQTSFGIVFLDASAMGSFKGNPGNVISGNVSGNTAGGYWSNSIGYTGKIQLALNPDGQSFTGTVSYMDGSQTSAFNGTCLGQAPLPPLPWRVLSSAQTSVRNKYGDPDMFMLTFVSTEANVKTRAIVQYTPPREIEVWSYLQRGIRDVFDDGVLTKESRFPKPRAGLTLPTTDLRVIDWASLMTVRQVLERMGTPDQVAIGTFGGVSTVTYRYVRGSHGAKAFVFENGRLAAVSAGFTVLQ